MEQQYTGPPQRVANAIGKIWEAELRRKWRLSPAGQAAARERAHDKKLYQQQRAVRRRA